MVLKILCWDRTYLGWYTLKVRNGSVTSWVSVCDNQHCLYDTIYGMNDARTLFLSPIMHAFFGAGVKACRVKNSPNLWSFEVLSIKSLLYQVKKRLESPSNRPSNFVQVGMKKRRNWLPPYVKATSDVNIIFNDGSKGGFRGYRLVAARDFKINETVAIMNLIADAPGDKSWTHDQVHVSKSKIWSCGPPTSDCLGVLMNASCFTSEKNCKFSKVDQKKKVMYIKASKTIRKHTELLAGQYMRGLGVPNIPLLKPGVGSFRQKTGRLLRDMKGRFAKNK